MQVKDTDKDTMGYTLDVAVIQPCVYILNEAKTRALDAITKY